jgi:uncharacterized protein (DUF849 family)
MISKRRRAPMRALGFDVIRTPDQDLREQAAAAAADGASEAHIAARRDHGRSSTTGMVS